MREISAKAKSVIGLSLDQPLKQKLIDIASYLGKSMTSVIGSLITNKYNELLGQVTVKFDNNTYSKIMRIELSKSDYDYLLYLINYKDSTIVTPYEDRDEAVAYYVRDLIDTHIHFSKEDEKKELLKRRIIRQ